MHFLHLSSLCAAVFSAAALPQGIALLEGPDSAHLSLRVLDELQPSAPGTVLLQNLEVVPIEMTGRTVMQELLGEGTRRMVRDGMARIELRGGGRLFQYRRQAGLSWGYLLVPADGRAHVLLELPGTGTGGTQSPFADRIGVSADGRNAAVPLVSGGLRLLRLDGSVFASTNAPSRAVATPHEVEPMSVMVGPSSVFFLTNDDHLYRLPLTDLAVPADLSPPAVQGGTFKVQMAMSDDGLAIACLYGPRNLQHLFVLRNTGAVVQLSPLASKYEEPGYLPEAAGQPQLLLDATGSRLFYVDSSSRDELFLLDVPGAVPPLQITGDPIFQPYIGSHILPKFVGTALVAAIGDVNAMDWFRADTTGSVVNLTQTGSAIQPFPAGTLVPSQAVQAGNRLLTTEQAGGGLLRLRSIDLQTSASTVLHGDLASAPQPGISVAALPADLLVQGSGGDRLVQLTTGLELAATPPGFLLTPPARGPQYSGTWLHLTSGFGLPVIYLPDGSAIAAAFEQGVLQVVMTLGGGCLINGQTLRYFAPGIGVTLNLPAAAIRLCISGAISS
jgi:hypothetical protein